VQFTKLEIIHDQDGWFDGAGKIFVSYKILNGNVLISHDTLPNMAPGDTPATVPLNDGQAWDDLKGPHTRFDTNAPQITVQASVFDEGSFFTEHDDKLRHDLDRTFYRNSNYGAGTHVHDTDDYRLHYTITTVDD